MDAETRRQKEIILLQDGEYGLSIGQLAEKLEIDDGKIIVEDLQHLRQTIRQNSLQLEVQPARCKKCDWEADIEKIKNPSKCAKCRSTWIEGLRVRIVQV